MIWILNQIKVSRVRLRVKHLIHASYKSYNRKQVHKFTTKFLNGDSKIPNHRKNKTALPLLEYIKENIISVLYFTPE